MMLLPLVAIAAIGLATFRSSVDALEKFREETVGKATLIDKTRNLLISADDVGEAYVEEHDAVLGDRFAVRVQQGPFRSAVLALLTLSGALALITAVRGG